MMVDKNEGSVGLHARRQFYCQGRNFSPISLASFGYSGEQPPKAIFFEPILLGGSGEMSSEMQV
ncbi:MAG: hypothetical protein ACK40X_03390 [Armatimonadota bacterium]